MDEWMAGWIAHDKTTALNLTVKKNLYKGYLQDPREKKINHKAAGKGGFVP